jgi:hypothetical protein
VSATETPAPPGTIRCARCGADVPPDRDWCLECGLAARTRVAPAPPWRIPLAVSAVVAVLALAALGLAFVDLTEDPPPPVTTPQPAATAPPTPTQAAPPATAPATTPAATAPVATTPQTQPSPTGGEPAP